MIFSIYLDSKFKKSLNELRKKGGTSFFAAKKVDDLIKRLLLRGRDYSHAVGRLTKNGEFRIKHCKKYDLANGYRLICFEEGNQLVLLYVGTHDECSRWLERNKGLKYKIDDSNGDFLVTKKIPAVYLPKGEEKDPVEEYEENIMNNIDDKTLRKIFSGLCE
jgi:hypothetical protein